MSIVSHITVATRDRKRLQDIVAVLVRFGVDDVLHRLGAWSYLKSFVPASYRASADIPQKSYPERVCSALEELGPTFVKLGQILSSRADILPCDWITAFEKLHNRAEPVSYNSIKDVMIESLGVDPHDIFDEFHDQPLAAGSIAQVYRACLTNENINKRDVIIKVQRPHIASLIEADLRILSHITATLHEHVLSLRVYRLHDIVHYLGNALREELDFTREGRNVEEIAENFKNQDDIVFPRIYWDYTSTRVLVQDYIDGITPQQALSVLPVDEAKNIAQRGTDAILQMAFVDCVFHGDPHSGNILILTDQKNIQHKIGFIDFGMVGRITPRRRDELSALIDAMVHEQGTRVRDILLKWSHGNDVDIQKLDQDTDAFVLRHRLPPLNFSEAMTDFMTLARTHTLILPADLVILFKALMTAEGVARKLDPDIDVIARAAPIVQRVFLQNLSWSHVGQWATHMIAESQSLAADAPSAVRGAMRILQRGRIGIEWDNKDIKQCGRAVERASMRLSIALVTAAFALGLAPRLTELDDRLFNYPIFTLCGLCLTILGIIALVFYHRKSDKDASSQ
jgi:ubiquinone biosynthesis protein